MQKRVWYMKFLFGVSQDTYKIDSCAFCRSELSRICLDCPYNIVSEEQKATFKYIFMLLHILQKRRESLFYTVDKNIIEKIIKYCLTTNMENTLCSVVHLECNHAYHRHCFEKWIKKRSVCPLDNLPHVMPVFISSTKRFPFVVSSCIMTENQILRREKRLKLFEQEKEEKTRLKLECERIENVIRDILKHNKFGFCYEDILSMTTDFFKQHKIGHDYFQLALENTIDKKHVYLIKGVYFHVFHTEYY